MAVVVLLSVFIAHKLGEIVRFVPRVSKMTVCMCSSVKGAESGIVNKAEGSPGVVNTSQNHTGWMLLFIVILDSDSTKCLKTKSIVTARFIIS